MLVLTLLTAPAFAGDSQIERGKYLVAISGCNDCHTPGYFFGKPDFSHGLSGSDVGFAVPGVGAVVGRNLTPDPETGLGNWTPEQIVTAFTTGVRPDGRKLSPIMPYMELANLTNDDAFAIAAYLKSLPPVKHAVPGPFGPKDVPSTPVFVIVPGEMFAKMPAP
jgi:mono/diheme cytochrome c family protein